MSLRNLSVRARNLLGFGLLAIILLVTGAVALTEIRAVKGSMVEIRDVWMAGLDWMGQIKSDRLNIRLQEELARTVPGKLENVREEIAQYHDDVSKLDTQYEDTIILDEDRRLFAVYQERSRSYEAALQQVLSSLESRSPDLASAEASRSAFDAMIKALDDLIELNRRGSQDAGERAEMAAESALLLFSALLGGGVLLTLFIAWQLSRSVTAPLAELQAVAARIAAGDLSQSVHCDGQDEITEVQRSLEQMQNNLRETLQAIQGSATQLASAAEQMHAITEQTSRGIHQQNEEIQMAATAVNEMSAAVDEVARNANHTSASSFDAEQTAQAGREQVSITSSTIEQLTGKLDVTSHTISQLAEEASGIGRVLEVIHTIAEQTNLLALNAAIEAARAGDQGRGFAVVADEVRALAQRTQTSTQEIERMISAIQSASKESVGAMQQSSEFAARSQELARKADSALQQIAERVSQINEMNLVIASAAEEQAQVAREVDRNLVAIRDIAEQSADGASQTSIASDELARLAGELNQMVARFRL